jgi:hypothetical protein
VTRTPVFGAVGECLSGRATVQAYGVVGDCLAEFRELYDHHNAMHFSLWCISCWQYVRLNLVGGLCVFLTSLSVVLARDHLDPGKAGVAMNFALLLTFYLTGYVFLAAEVEARFSSVERLHEFATMVPPEPLMYPPAQGRIEKEASMLTVDEASGVEAVGESWPSRGRIEARGLTVSYEASLPPTLKGIPRFSSLYYHIWTYNPRFSSLYYHIWTYNPRFCSPDAQRYQLFHPSAAEACHCRANRFREKYDNECLVPSHSCSSRNALPRRDRCRVRPLASPPRSLSHHSSGTHPLLWNPPC